MAELKTKPNARSVESFLDGVADEEKRRDAFAVARLMQEITKAEPRMWGDTIVGFGSYHYRYASGREGDWPVIGFSPRKQDLTLYLMSGFDGCEELLAKLGKHRTGKSCLYIKRLDDVHLPTLKKLMKESVRRMKKTYGA
jgi:hypothetical protein